MAAFEATYALACLGAFAVGAVVSHVLWPQGALPTRFLAALGAGAVLAALVL